MVDLTITAANVVPGSNAKKITGVAGGTVTAGQPCYRDATTRKLSIADNDSGTAALRVPVGIALHGASLNQPLIVQEEGDINLGAALVVGKTYVLSDTPGGIMPVEDLEIGDYVVVLGVATTASNLKMKIIDSGVAVAA